GTLEGRYGRIESDIDRIGQGGSGEQKGSEQDRKQEAHGSFCLRTGQAARGSDPAVFRWSHSRKSAISPHKPATIDADKRGRAAGCGGGSCAMTGLNLAL